MPRTKQKTLNVVDMKDWKKISDGLYYNESEDVFLNTSVENPTDDYLNERLNYHRKITFESLDE